MAKPVYIEEKLHGRLKGLAKEKGMSFGGLIEGVVHAWLQGHVFFLPEAKPCPKASNAKRSK